MRIVSGKLASALQPGDLDISLQGHERPYALEQAYRGIGSLKGQSITMTLITLPGLNPGRHPLLEFDVERVVLVSLQIGDDPQQENDSACRHNAT